MQVCNDTVVKSKKFNKRLYELQQKILKIQKKRKEKETGTYFKCQKL